MIYIFKVSGSKVYITNNHSEDEGSNYDSLGIGSV